MNTAYTEAKFWVSIEGYTQDVWPLMLHKPDDPFLKRVDENLRDSFDQEEDGPARASVEVKSMKELLRVLKLYEGKDVNLGIHMHMRDGAMRINAGLDDRVGRKHAGSYTMLDDNDMTHMQAFDKIGAVVAAMKRKESERKMEENRAKRQKSAPVVPDQGIS